MAAGALGAAGKLVQVVASLAVVVIAAPLFKRTRLASVLGYFVEGLSIGPFSFGLFTDGPRSPTWSNVGSYGRPAYLHCDDWACIL